MGFQSFENDEELIDAVVHNLTVIGEAANHIPPYITGRHPEIPWRQMVDLRNFAVHAYWNLHPWWSGTQSRTTYLSSSSRSDISCPRAKVEIRGPFVARLPALLHVSVDSLEDQEAPLVDLDSLVRRSCIRRVMTE